MNTHGKTIVLGTTVETSETQLCHLDDVRRNNQFVLATEGSSDEKKSFLEIDYSWLPLCADTYQISPDIRDYVFVSVPILTLGIPNRNSQSFHMLECSSWDVNQGKPVYKTFIGKPTYTNHKQNTIPHLAKGVHFDSHVCYVPKYDIYKVIVLLGFDRKKDEGLCKAITNNKGVTGYSMGAMVETFLDSHTGKFIGLNDPDYKRNRGTVDKEGRLRYVSCVGATFFETSCLGDFGRGDPGEPPADSEALSSSIWG